MDQFILYIDMLKVAVLDYNTADINNNLVKIIDYVDQNRNKFSNNLDLILNNILTAMQNKDYYLLLDLTQFELLNLYKNELGSSEV